MPEALDHPITFLVLITLGVWGLTNIFAWGLKAANLPGPANAMGG